MKKEITEKVKEWIKKADNDLKTCKKELNSEEPIIETIAFHAQQAVEKYLKAFLTYHNVPFGKTHNIALLIEKCKKLNKEFEYLYEIEADKLYPIGITIRYPYPYDLTLEEVAEFVKIAEKVRDFVLKKLNIDENKN